MNVCRAPKTAQEFVQYYRLRWKMLREPWQQPFGSEQDSLEKHSIHRMILDEQGEVVAVGRLDQSEQQQAHIRFMAVQADQQGKGLGQQIVAALEAQAQKFGIEIITLNAREQAINFYEKLGYQLAGFSHLLFDEIKHFSMSKTLASHRNHQLPQSIKLQQLWHQTIPMSKAMNLLISYYDQQQLITHCDTVFNKNLHNTMFAGSIYTHATLTGWAWVYFQMQYRQLTGDIVLAEGKIRYHSPITGVAHANVNHTDVKGEFNTLLTGKKAKISVDVHLLCGENIAATFSGQYVILAKKIKAKKINSLAGGKEI